MAPRKRQTRIIEEDGPKRIRAVSYVRQSTEGQDDLLSPEAQVRRIETFAHRDDVDMVGGYDDIAISGATAAKRPGFQRMIKDATSAERPFDMIIVYDISRFSRNTRELLNYRHQLKQHGVSVQSVTEPHHGDAASDELWTHTSAGNEAMLPRTARKTRDSQFEAVKRGYHPGGVPPFGFRTEQEVVQTERYTPRGQLRIKETTHSILVPDPDTAEHVVKMYDLNNSGHSTADVAEYLTGQGVKTRDGNDFSPGAVLYILRNKRNIGYQERGRDSSSDYLPHDEMEVNEQAHEGIIPPDVWEKAQEILDGRTPKARAPRSQSSANRFTELTECGECGSPMNLAANRVLVCSRKKVRAAYCPNSHREKLDDVQKPAIRLLLDHLIVEEFLNEHVDRVVELNKVLVKELKKRHTTIEGKTKAVQEKINNLVDTTEEARKKNRRVDEIFDRLDHRRQELRELQEEENQLAAESEDLMSYVNDRDRIIQNALDVRTIIETDEPQVANSFIRLFVKKLVIKDHVGTLHFTVPPLSEGPYRAPESFGIGKHLFTRPTEMDQEASTGLFCMPDQPRHPRRCTQIVLCEILSRTSPAPSGDRPTLLARTPLRGADDPHRRGATGSDTTRGQFSPGFTRTRGDRPRLDLGWTRRRRVPPHQRRCPTDHVPQPYRSRVQDQPRTGGDAPLLGVPRRPALPYPRLHGDAPSCRPRQNHRDKIPART